MASLPSPLPPKRLAATLFFLSFATVLFTLAIWRLLAFFIMPSLFFDLLFVGFPLGAFIGSKFFRVTSQSFRKTLWILQGAMWFSVAASLSCKHFDYLRAHLFEVELIKLLGQMGIFTGLFIPFFCAYGLSEYLGYQLGRQTLQGRMRFVYAVYLFGAAFAYIFMEVTLHKFGVMGVSQMLALSILLVSLASFMLSATVSGRVIAGVKVVVLAGLCIAGGTLESWFLNLYKGAGFQSTQQYVTQNQYTPRYQRWGKYSLTEILAAPESGTYAGFYNDLMQWEFTSGTGFSERKLGAVPLNLVPERAKIAIIGAGGGRQVRWLQQPAIADKKQLQKVVAIELEPAVFDAVRGPLKDEFDRVYESAKVQTHLGEARTFMENAEESFDLIFLPSVGGYPQMMLEPGNMIRTRDAYETIRNRLTDRGILAIWYPAGLDPEEILTQQYVRTLGNQGLGMKTRAYCTLVPQAGTGPLGPYEYLILAAKDTETTLPEPEEIDQFLKGETLSDIPVGPLAGSVTRDLIVATDPEFKPITDEQPYLAGNVRHIFSLRQLYELFGLTAGLLLVLGGVLVAVLRKTGNPRIPGRSYWHVTSLAVLIGANFILFEHFVVLALFKKLYVFHDALALGAISFLVISGLGSIVITPRTRTPFQIAAVALVLCLFPLQDQLSSTQLLLLISPVAFVTGSFFPALFELAAKNPLAVFAMDAVGAALGAMCSFFLPIVFGFSTFFPVAGVVFIVTAVFTWHFYKGVERDVDSPASNQAAAGGTVAEDPVAGGAETKN